MLISIQPFEHTLDTVIDTTQLLCIEVNSLRCVQNLDVTVASL